MKNRLNIASGAIWEDIIGYSRAVRIGNVIEVAGTAPADEHGVVVAKGDVYTQTVFCLRKIEKTIHLAGGSLEDVVRTRLFVADITQWEKIGRAHGEFFGNIKPVTTMVEVSRLIDTDMLIEIEATALLS
ncbi:MAG: RidA family protein [Saprospiraceae bacterium]|nr:RidA family protein [Saprospiraceae bacterium]MBP7679436.1 RidA family protein [Saprospiraceae bacterium]